MVLYSANRTCCGTAVIFPGVKYNMSKQEVLDKFPEHLPEVRELADRYLDYIEQTFGDDIWESEEVRSKAVTLFDARLAYHTEQGLLDMEAELNDELEELGYFPVDE